MAMMKRRPTGTRQTARVNDLTLWESIEVNGKLVASGLSKAAGWGVGGFKSAASTAANHAASNKGGKIDRMLTETIADQYREAEEEGFNLIEDSKDLLDFNMNVVDTGTSGKSSTSQTTANQTTTNKGN